jgi:hypothetical protein
MNAETGLYVSRIKRSNKRLCNQHMSQVHFTAHQVQTRFCFRETSLDNPILQHPDHSRAENAVMIICSRIKMARAEVKNVTLKL